MYVKSRKQTKAQVHSYVIPLHRVSAKRPFTTFKSDTRHQHLAHGLNFLCVSQRLCHSNGKGGLRPRPDHMGFDTGRVAMGHLVFRILWFVPVSIILHIPFPLPRVLSYSDLPASE